MGPGYCGRILPLIMASVNDCPFPKGEGGPGGIRTRDLISAIDARSQLRYRPVSQQILSEGEVDVKPTTGL
jgi:hypothetical protein